MMWLASPILFALLVQSVLGDVIKVPFYRRSRSPAAKGLDAVKPSLEIVDYMADISIGTPPQWFSVSLTPSLSYTWVADSSCSCPTICNAPFSCLTGFCSKDSECCDADFGHDVAKRVPESDFRGLVVADHARDDVLPPLKADRGIGDCNAKRVRFDSSKSSTYKKSGIRFNNTDPAPHVWGNGGGPQSSGFTGFDVVSLGSLSIEDAMFGQAVKVHMDSDTDGVLGLAPSAASPSGIDSLVVTAFKKGVIEQPIATFWIANASVETMHYAPVVGEITYGGVDGANCGPVPVYHPISSFRDTTNSRIGWFVKGSVSVGTATIRPPQIELGLGSGLFLDDTYLRQLLKGIGVTDSYYFPCTTKFSMTLTIDGHDYVIPSDAVVDRDGSLCQIMADNRGQGQFRIGESFLLMYCHSLDVGNNRIGFAPNLNIACDPQQPNNHCPGSH